MARLRLLELLRIAEQHEVVCGRGDREHVGERHLSGLVDEQRRRCRETGSRPEPTCRRSEQSPCRNKFATRELESNAWIRGLPSFGLPLCKHF
jgi:hypothetical protein